MKRKNPLKERLSVKDQWTKKYIIDGGFNKMIGELLTDYNSNLRVNQVNKDV